VETKPDKITLLWAQVGKLQTQKGNLDIQLQQIFQQIMQEEQKQQIYKQIEREKQNKEQPNAKKQ